MVCIRDFVARGISGLVLPSPDKFAAKELKSLESQHKKAALHGLSLGGFRFESSFFA